MKVLMYGWELPPNISGGLGVACHGIVQGLLDNGVEVSLILPENFPLSKTLFPKFSKIAIYQVPFYHEMTNVYCVKHNQTLLSAVTDYARNAGLFASRIGHDVIHVHDWLTILAGIEAKQTSHKPLIFHVHSLEVERSGKSLNSVIYDIEKKGLKSADKIIAVSEFTKRNIIKHYGIEAKKIYVVYNGLFKEQIMDNPTRPLPSQKLKTVLFLGRVTHQKAPFNFIEVARKILEKRKDIQFVVCGDGDLLHDVVEYVAKLKLGSHIHFTRFLNRDDVKKIYSQSHIYLMPSIAEPFGLTTLEAIAQHVPVICSKQSGVSEVIKNIIKVDFWDIDKMCEKVCSVIDHPDQYQEMVKNSVLELRELEWTKAAQKIVEVYKTA